MTVQPHSHAHPHECASLLGAISDYVDGDLREELCRELEKHLSECENCRVVVDTMKKTVYLVHASEDPNAPAPEDVRARLFKRLDLDEFLQKKG